MTVTQPNQPDPTDLDELRAIASRMGNPVEHREVRAICVAADEIEQLRHQVEQLTGARNVYKGNAENLRDIIEEAHRALDEAGIPARPVRPLKTRIEALSSVGRDAAKQTLNDAARMWEKTYGYNMFGVAEWLRALEPEGPTP